MAEDMNKIYEMYGYKSINGHLILNNVTKEDNSIITTKITPQTNQSYWSDFLFKDYPQKIKAIVEKIQKGSTRIKPITLSLSNDPNNKDTLNISALFDYKKVYLSPMEYYYLKKPNSIKWQVNYSFYNNRLNQLHKKIQENELSCGMVFSQRKQKKAFFIQNELYTKSPLEFGIKYKRTKYTNDFKRKTFQTSTKLNMAHNFLKRSFIFREFFPFDPLHRLNFTVAQKNITNICDEQNASNEMLSNLPEQDYQVMGKVSYEKNKLKSNDLKGYRIKIASSIIRSLNSLYVKNKFFIRQLYTMDNLLLQFNAEGGKLISLDKKDIEQLKVHEKFFIYNYRGIVNPAGKCSATDKNHFYMLGNTAYVLLAAKLMMKIFPMLTSYEIEKEGFQIMPFTHINLLMTKEQENKEILSPIRISGGIGISVLSKLFSFELLYTPYIHKTMTDVHAKFHVKFGID